MVSPNKYRLIARGICANCNSDKLEWENQRGYVCRSCGCVYLVDKRRQCVLEPDCQNRF